MLRPEVLGKRLGELEFRKRAGSRVSEALDWMLIGFEGHLRDDGVTPFSDHCLAVAEILLNLGCDDEEVLIAGLLHDLVEDHPEQGGLAEIERRFGKRVVFLVNGVTALTINGRGTTDFENLQKIIKETGVDAQVSLIKLADRLHNLWTLRAKPRGKQKKKAEETLRVYVPLAKSLGLWTMASVLSDIAFEYTDPETFATVKTEIDCDPRLRPEFIENWVEKIEAIVGIGLVKIKVGSYKELYEKQRRSVIYGQGAPKGYGEIDDVLNLRVVLRGGNKSIYESVGKLLHHLGKQVDVNSIKDLIATPSHNGYRAFQMTLMTEVGPVELSVASERMENFNHNGILARGGVEKISAPVMVFTPKEELLVFTGGTTALDMAYEISWNLGLNAGYVLVNGVREGLSYVLKNGDQVEVIPVEQERATPEEKWLDFANQQTREIISSQLKAVEIAGLRREGRLLLEKELSSVGMINIQDLSMKYQKKLLMRLHCADVDELYMKVAIRHSYLKDVMARVIVLIEEYKKEYGFSDLATIAIRGEGDRGGISAELSLMISGLGGSIISNREKTDGNHFSIRRFVHGLSNLAKEKLRRRLSVVEEYREVIVV